MATLVPLLIVLLLAPAARADRGEMAVGLEAGGIYPWAKSAGLSAQLGLSDWVAARAGFGVELGPKRTNVGGSAYLVVVGDIVAWVPELALGVAMNKGGDVAGPRLLGSLGVQRYVGLEWSAGVRLGAAWDRDGWLGIAMLSLWWHPG